MGAVTLPDPSGTLPGVFQQIGLTRHGGFLARNPIPATLGVGKGLPRYAYFIYAADIDAHLRRLDQAGAIRSDPVRTSSAGGCRDCRSIGKIPTATRSRSYGAPDVRLEGAMAGCAGERIGRISHGVFESRDLERTAAFYRRFCDLEPVRNDDVAEDILALRLGAGGRLIFQRVDELGGRTTGLGLRDAHTALLVHEDRLLSQLPAAVGSFTRVGLRSQRRSAADRKREALPARTVLHPSPAGRRFRRAGAPRRRLLRQLEGYEQRLHFYTAACRSGDLLAVSRAVPSTAISPNGNARSK